MQQEKINYKREAGPVLAGYFVMAFSDIVPPLTPRIAETFPEALHPLIALLPTSVFLWFLLLSTPLAAAMNRIGRKKMALAGYTAVVVGLLTAWFGGEGTGIGFFFAGFTLLGMGCTAVQIAINPMLALVAPPRQMAIYLTAGQVFRSTALLMMAPLITLLTLYTSWNWLLLIYAAITLLSGVWMVQTKMDRIDRVENPRYFSLSDCFALMKDRVVALAAFAIALFLILDVSIGYLSVQLVEMEQPLLTTTGFYLCRIVGPITGIWAISKMDEKRYLMGNLMVALAAVVALCFTHSQWAVCLLLGVIGFSISVVFSIFYASATAAQPQKANEVAGLLMWMISAGALASPLVEGMHYLGGNIRYGLLIPIAALLYLITAAFLIGKKR